MRREESLGENREKCARELENSRVELMGINCEKGNEFNKGKPDQGKGKKMGQDDENFIHSNNCMRCIWKSIKD